MRYGQIVIGPAGSGKVSINSLFHVSVINNAPCHCQSTYCSNVVKYCQELKRTVHVVNLDPAAEEFSYHAEVGMGPCRKNDMWTPI